MDDADIEECFASIGQVAIRRMFGGKGVYSGGRIIAVVVAGDLLLKSDAETTAAFEAAGCRRWTYEREGASPVAMPYHALPGEAFDDPDMMANWARLAVEAAHRSPPPKAPRSSGRKKRAS